MAWIRCQAVVTASAQGQLAAIFADSAASAADEADGGAQDAVAQGLWLCCGDVAVQGQELQPGQQDAGGHSGVKPGLVQPVVIWEMSQAGVLAGEG